MTDKVPEWVYRPDLRAPGTDDEPWHTLHTFNWRMEEPRRRRNWSRIATVLCVVAMVAIAFAAGYSSK